MFQIEFKSGADVRYNFVGGRVEQILGVGEGADGRGRAAMAPCSPG